jgi:adenosylcobinamide kinase/adenosylcobinamide-phosphate guanylyltransferase
MLGNRAHVDYVACGAAFDHDADPAWSQRIRLHRQRRPAGWTTLETLDLEAVLTGRDLPAARQGSTRAEQIPVLADCLSTWLAGVMDECGLWTALAGETGLAGENGLAGETALAGENGPAGESAVAEKAIADRIDALAEAWRSTSRLVVAVSNEVGLGVVPATASGVRYRDELGRLNARIAADSEQVWLCVAGLAQRLK